MARDETKGHSALRRSRISIPGARYFLTLCTVDRQRGLVADTVGNAINHEVANLEKDVVWRVMAMTLMPDHAHFLVELGGVLPLPKAVARLKAKTAPALSAAGIKWERGFFDRHLRPDDRVAAIIRYIAMNPVRAGLINAGDADRWGWFRLGDEEAQQNYVLGIDGDTEGAAAGGALGWLPSSVG